MVGTATFENTGATLSPPPASWAASHGANPKRTDSHSFDGSGGYGVTTPKAQGVTTAQLNAMFNQPAITPTERNTAPRLPESARQATQTLNTAADRQPVGARTSAEASKASSQQNNKGFSR